MMFLSRYNDRESKVEIKHEIETNGRKGKTYFVNEILITVWDDGEVTARRDHYKKTSVDSVLPNMTIDDGVINIHLEDLTALVLARATPLEIAQGLLTDDEVKEHMIYIMAEKYGSDTINDADRRKFLARVKTAVHSVSIQEAIRVLNALEEGMRIRTSDLRWKKASCGHYRNIYEYALEHLPESKQQDFLSRHTEPKALEEFLISEQDPMQLENVGKQWGESRDFWRRELLKHFPGPEIPE